MYERLINSMRGFLKQRETDRVALYNGELPTKQQQKMDSIIKQATRFGAPILEARVKELESQLAIDTLNPNRRVHIIELQEKIRRLEWEVKHEIYQHWVTCESEGLSWDNPPEDPGEFIR